MKKIVALLLTLLLCFSLCACGRSDDSLKEKSLIDKEWCGLLDFTINGQRVVTFKKGGVGTIVYPEANNQVENFTWSISENLVSITVNSTDPFGGAYTTEDTYEYNKTENSTQLKSTSSSVILVLKENYETETIAYKQKLLNEATDLDWKTASSVKLDNEVKFKNEYVGKTFKYTAKVYNIDTQYCEVANETYLGLPVNSIKIFMDSKDLAKISKHSTITVVGILSSSGSLAHAFLIEE